jgi:hypothetical protein
VLGRAYHYAYRGYICIRRMCVVRTALHGVASSNLPLWLIVLQNNFPLLSLLEHLQTLFSCLVLSHPHYLVLLFNFGNKSVRHIQVFLSHRRFGLYLTPRHCSNRVVPGGLQFEWIPSHVTRSRVRMCWFLFALLQRLLLCLLLLFHVRWLPAWISHLLSILPSAPYEL